MHEIICISLLLWYIYIKEIVQSIYKTKTYEGPGTVWLGAVLHVALFFSIFPFFFWMASWILPLNFVFSLFILASSFFLFSSKSGSCDLKTTLWFTIQPKKKKWRVLSSLSSYPATPTLLCIKMRIVRPFQIDTYFPFKNHLLPFVDFLFLIKICCFQFLQQKKGKKIQLLIPLNGLVSQNK